MTEKKKLAIFRFPGKGSERFECVDWLMNTVAVFANHPKYHLYRPTPIQDTPITMVRNQAVRAAQAAGVDYMVMVDDDVCPDYLVGKDPTAKPFLSTALEFLGQTDRPSVIAAPYCGPPPDAPVYVFDWNWDGIENGADFRATLQMVPRLSAAYRTGVHPAAALPTGLMLIDMRVFDLLPPPYFYYEATDATWTEKASTEDVAFSRDLSMSRVPLYCQWDSWCQHVKTVRVGKPLKADVKIANDRIREIVRSGHKFDDAIVYQNPSVDPMWPTGLPMRDPNDDHRSNLPIIPGAVREHLPLFGPRITPKAEQANGDGKEAQAGTDRGVGEPAGRAGEAPAAT